VSDSTETTITTKPKPAERTRLLPPFHVILENDDHHTFPFVISVLRKVFGFQEERAIELAFQAHSRGRTIVWTGSKEVAELKLEQMLTFSEIRDDGRKLGPLGVFIEPAN
jgi:ATP-dependent Clp protease adaptor protein ClpS